MFSSSQTNCRMCLMILMCLVSLISFADAQIPKGYDMDEFATCGRTVNVDDSGVRINGRGHVSPSQPPTLCIVYLQSVYANDDVSNKLQVEVESLHIKDCNVEVNVYNGRNSVGRTLKTMSCQYSSAGIFYSTGREITVKLTRPDQVVHNENQFTLLIKPWKDRDVPGTQNGVSSLSVAAIIGIIISCLVLVGLIILFFWFLCTGRLGNFNIPGRSIKSSSGYVNGGISNEKTNAEMMKVKDPIEFDSKPYTIQNAPAAPRLYQRNVPRQISNVRHFDNQDGEYVNDRPDDNGYRNRNDSRWSRGPRHDYEPYNVQETVQSQASSRKETLIDDVFDSDSATKDSDNLNNSGFFDDETLQKRTAGEKKNSPKLNRKDKVERPEELDDISPQLERYKSMDLQSQPDQDTIASPHHINAGIRASIEDEDLPPQGSLKRKDKGVKKSPKSKRKGGKEPDAMAMPPEAFEPIFTAPITGIDYKSNQPNQAYGYPGYPPYGLIPAGMFAPGVPGTQTYAYAYQTVPPGGMPAQQGAWVVQNTPTAEGNRRTAFVMEETPNQRGARNLTPESKRKNKHHLDPFKDKDRPRQRSNQEPDLSVVARGAAPPDPGQGHRSVAMKSGTDPQSGIHTTQVVWTDTAPDPSDPKPGDNPQVTRKTVTRVTTKSGYGDLPAATDPLMLLGGEDEPSFLNPSKGRIGNHNKQPAFLEAPPVPSAYAPSRENIDFYTGPPHGTAHYPYSDHHSVAPPERTSTPQIPVHQHPSYNAAIRDRIPFDDSTV
ncbi:hypothetical protein EGW08_015121 [Elysia chlorotica]|uniref:CUB domain-containing protein n=1 Tax=Elysia chlorotica TaxID=188477 RepID=A0A433T6B3_ELYCH|nr:hypothetical protein EGW08_015121 [Elysia chlorotica]